MDLRKSLNVRISIVVRGWARREFRWSTKNWMSRVAKSIGVEIGQLGLKA